VNWESDLVIPFNVKKEVCVDLFNSWVKELWFAPSDLMDSAVLKDFKMVYVPFWVYDAETLSKYVIGYSDKLFGEIKESGTTKHKFKDFLICASKCEEAQVIEQVEPRKMDQITSFTLRHAEGADVRAFDWDADSTWRNKTKPKIDQHCKDDCRRKMKINCRADIITKINVETSCLHRTARRLFVPIYSTSFEYAGKSYLFIVNGSTAKAYGFRPYSTSKLASISFTGIGAALGILTGSKLSPPLTPTSVWL